MLDRQAIYDRIAAHLVAQGEPAIIGTANGPICAYRTPSGLRCAIGALIADEAFDPDLNGAPVVHPAVIAMLLASGLDIDMGSEDLDFLSDVQAAHDSVDRHEGPWLSKALQRLDELRQKYGLKDLAFAGEREPALA